MGRRKNAFASDDAFHRFVGEVTLAQRFVWSDETTQFLGAVRASGARRTKIIPKDSSFYRAQLGGLNKTTELVKRTKEDPISEPHPEARMKPQWHLAKEGRANAAGIPCLYMADTEDTAIAEVRPWVDAWVSLGRFATNQELRVVDCSVDTIDAPFRPYGFTLAEREQAVWYQINRAFARPTINTDTRSDYAPTQIIAELFKADGIGGLIYRSSCSAGNNIVLFSPLLADMEVCWLSRVEAVSISWHVAGANYVTERFGS